MSALTHLDLRGCYQLSSLPHALGQLQVLQTLVLGSFRLVSLPASMGQLVTLTDVTFHSSSPAALWLEHLAAANRQLAAARARMLVLVLLGLRRGRCQLPPELWFLIDLELQHSQPERRPAGEEGSKRKANWIAGWSN